MNAFISQATAHAGRCFTMPLSQATIAGLQSKWEDLSSDCSESNPFLLPALVSAALPLLSEQDVTLVGFEDATGQLIGLFLAGNRNSYAHLPVQLWESASHDHAFLETPLVRKGCERAFAAAMMDWLDYSQTARSGFLFQRIHSKGRIAAAIELECTEQKRRCDIVWEINRPTICISGTIEEYRKTLISSSKRKQVRRKLKGLQKLGNVEFQSCATNDDFAEWLDGFLEMELLGWKGRSGTAILNSDVEREYYHNWVGSLSHQPGTMMMHRLCISGQPIAYTLDAIHNGELFTLKSTYDEHYAKHSPGVLLEYECMGHYWETEGIRCVDSCAAEDHSVLSSLWKERKSIGSLLIGRKGFPHELALNVARLLERLASTVREVSSLP